MITSLLARSTQARLYLVHKVSVITTEADTMTDSFTGAFIHEDGPEYCFDYGNIAQLRSMNLPAGLLKILNTDLQDIENAKVSSLSTGLGGRYWIVYAENGKDYHHST